jgi:hypothetical protein
MKMDLMLNKTQMYSMIRPPFWDYNTGAGEIHALLAGEKASAGPFNFEQLFIRLLERLPWYDLVSIFGINNLKLLLVPERIQMIRDKELQDCCEFIGRVLRGETVSFTGWSTRSRERVKHTLLSHRWYSLK